MSLKYKRKYVSPSCSIAPNNIKKHFIKSNQQQIDIKNNNKKIIHSSSSSGPSTNIVNLISSSRKIEFKKLEEENPQNTFSFPDDIKYHTNQCATNNDELTSINEKNDGVNSSELIDNAKNNQNETADKIKSIHTSSSSTAATTTTTIHSLKYNPDSKYPIYDSIVNENNNNNPIVAIDSFFVISKRILPMETQNAIKKDLTMIPRIYGGCCGNNDGFFAFSEYDDVLCTPRFYGMFKFPQCVQKVLAESKYNVIVDGEPLCNTVVFEGSLHPNSPQEAAYVKIIDWYKTEQQWPTKGCIVELPCGFGKTVLAIYIAIVLGRKTLVLVHTDTLLQQWCDRIKTFAPNARIGIAKANIMQFDNCDFVVGTVQSFAKDKYGFAILDTFGFVILDECHHIAARYFSTALFGIRARYILGLSATPKRFDGLERLLNWSMGPIVYRAKRSDIDDPVRIAQITYCNGKQFELKRKTRVNGGNVAYKDEYIRPIMLNRLCDELQRNCVIATTLINLYKRCFYGGLNQRRKTIVLSDRLEQLKTIDDMLQKIGNFISISNSKDNGSSRTERHKDDNRNKSSSTKNNKIKKTETQERQNNSNNNDSCLLSSSSSTSSTTNNDNRLEQKNEISVAFYIGATKPKDRDTAANCADVILATYHIASEGLDIPLLDTLVFASPRTNIEQPIGRILRVAHGKSSPLIIDFVDPFACYNNMANTRCNVYKKFNYIVSKFGSENENDAIIDFMSDKNVITNQLQQQQKQKQLSIQNFFSQNESINK